MKNQFFKTLIEKRFQNNGVNTKKERIDRKTVTELGKVDKLAELLLLNKVKIQNCKTDDFSRKVNESVDNALYNIQSDDRNVDNDDNVNEQEEAFIEENVEKFVSSLPFHYSFPPRVPYENIDKRVYKEIELRVFNHWKKVHNELIFERNLEVWRQFWITCEKSDVIVQVIDSRNPSFFLNDDIRKMYADKRHIIFANKSDLCRNKVKIEGYEVFYYSALGKNRLSNFIDNIDCKNIGLIGYPNVGKSSTINMLIQKKKVQVSQTPGKTRYIQTIIYDENKILFDCPGLVFPRHSKVGLLLHGVLNVDKIIDLKSSLYDIVKFIGIGSLSKHYRLPPFVNDSRYPIEINFVNHMAEIRNMSVASCLKNIIKDLVSGKIQYDRIQEQLSVYPDYSWCEDLIRNKGDKI